MSPTTLKVKKNSVSLPADWVKTYGVDEVAAVPLGDVLVLRPVKTVTYSFEAEAKALEAVRAFKQSKNKGDVRELGDKKFADLLKEAEVLD